MFSNFVRSLALLGSMVMLASAEQPDIILRPAYEKIRTARQKAPSYIVRNMDAETKKLLEKAKREWNLHVTEVPDEAFIRVAELIGVDATVKDLVKFYTHKILPYAENDHRRNLKEIVIAAAQTTALPVSVDNVIYVGDGRALVKCSKDCLEVFEDTKDGLMRVTYMRAKNAK